MEYLVGIALALAVSVSATLIGLDKDRSFYPTVLTVSASYYDLFAVIGGSTQALMVESLVMVVFVSATVLGFKLNLWIVVVALLPQMRANQAFKCFGAADGAFVIRIVCHRD